MASADTYEVRRNIHVQAPPDQVRPHLADFHEWQAWSPLEDLDVRHRRGG